MSCHRLNTSTKMPNTMKQRRGGARTSSHHGSEARPFHMPPKRAKQRKSYRMANVIAVIAVALCVLSVIWGYSVIYQVGYAAAEHYCEVNHD